MLHDKPVHSCGSSRRLANDRKLECLEHRHRRPFCCYSRITCLLWNSDGSRNEQAQQEGRETGGPRGYRKGKAFFSQGGTFGWHVKTETRRQKSSKVKKQRHIAPKDPPEASLLPPAALAREAGCASLFASGGPCQGGRLRISLCLRRPLPGGQATHLSLPPAALARGAGCASS